MTHLPIVERPVPSRPPRWRTYALHVYRVGVFVAIIAAIHLQQRWVSAQRRGAGAEPLSIEQVSPFYSRAKELGPFDPDHGGQAVLDAAGKKLGFVVQTSPEADDVVGFSGPTNMLIAFGADDRIVGLAVLRSGDTREHTRDVVQNEQFMTALNGISWQEASRPEVDAVSGATLTSSAIMEGIALRLGGTKPASLFPDEITVDEVQPFFEAAVRLEDDDDKPSMRRVLDAEGNLLGKVARTSPHADQMIGYQGPTDTLIALDPEGLVVGAAIRHSFDNEPYVQYVREDEYFFSIFKGFRLEDISALDMIDAGIEGVSGATITSTTVAEAIIHTAGVLVAEKPRPKPKPLIELHARDYGTATIVVLALVIGLTHLRGIHWLRFVFQVALVVYLGFINADMVSQALLVGWAQHGVAWQVAPALVLLTAAALACPIFTGRQVYCTHMCPFGALQDWLRPVPMRVKPPRPVDKLLRSLPAALLLLVVLVAMLHWPLSLVGIEPFDAFVIRIASWATITVAVVGLVAALFVPMAYCHYGCPTGAMLNFLRLNAASGRWSRQDWFATGLVLLSFGIYAAGL